MKAIKEYLTIELKKVTKRKIYWIAHLTTYLTFLFLFGTKIFGWYMAIPCVFLSFLSGGFWQFWMNFPVNLKKYGIDMIEGVT